jgi:hypothetical protein
MYNGETTTSSSFAMNDNSILIEFNDVPIEKVDHSHYAKIVSVSFTFNINRKTGVLVRKSQTNPIGATYSPGYQNFDCSQVTERGNKF